MDPQLKALKELKELHEYYRTGRFSKLGIAIALGVNRRTVRRWFQGKYPPTGKHRKGIEHLVKELRKEGLNSKDVYV